MNMDRKIESAKKIMSWLENKGCIIDKYIEGNVTTYNCIKYVDGNPYDTIFVAIINNDSTIASDVAVVDQIVHKKLISDHIDRLGIQHADSWEEFMLKFSILES